MYHSTSSFCLVRWVIIAVAGSLYISSAKASDTEAVSFGAKLYAHYGALLSAPPSEGGSASDLYPNGFDIQRVYLTTRGKIDDTFSLRVTTDVSRTNEQKLEVVLKYAYLQAKLGSDVKLMVGSAGTPYVGMTEQFWGHRWVAKSFTDQEGLLDSADLGVHLKGSHGEGFVSWQTSVINGEGYGNPETNATKAAEARLTVDPLKGGSLSLPVTIFASKDVYNEADVAGGTTLVAAVGLDHKAAAIWGEYVMADDGEVQGGGMSVAAVIKAAEVANVVFRYDQWDPDPDTDEDGHTTLRAGLTRDIAKKTSVGLMFESTRPEVDPDLNSNGVFLRMQAGF